MIARIIAEGSDNAQGLQWVLEMYARGDCGDYRYTYDQQTPSLGEVKDYLRTQLSERAQPAAAFASAADDILWSSPEVNCGLLTAVAWSYHHNTIIALSVYICQGKFGQCNVQSKQSMSRLVQGPQEKI